MPLDRPKDRNISRHHDAEHRPPDDVLPVDVVPQAPKKDQEGELDAPQRRVEQNKIPGREAQVSLDLRAKVHGGQFLAALHAGDQEETVLPDLP